MNITPKKNPKEFEQFLFREIDLDLFEYKFLNDYVQGVMSGEKKLYDLSLINSTKESWILILHSEVLLIYGNNWNVSQFKEIKEIFDLNSFTNFTITGTSDLIYALMESYGITNYSIEKERTFYKTKTIQEFKDNKLKIENANIKDLGELAIMLQEYYHEEYNGKNDKSIDDMRQRIFQLIYSNTIYVLKDLNNKLLSFCTIINPDIGILFTKKEYRKLGYGKFILSFCSKLLLQINSDVYLMTDKEEVVSNITCQKVGYKPYYNFSFILINCG